MRRAGSKNVLASLSEPTRDYVRADIQKAIKNSAEWFPQPAEVVRRASAAINALLAALRSPSSRTWMPTLALTPGPFSGPLVARQPSALVPRAPVNHAWGDTVVFDAAGRGAIFRTDNLRGRRRLWQALSFLECGCDVSSRHCHPHGTTSVAAGEGCDASGAS
jgi:hypothetical protein